jgi:hypothetical protein
MKEIHKIYLVCLVILILFFIIYFSKEHFKNLFEQQTPKLLQVSPQENEKSCNNTEGLYVIECPFLREDKDNKKKIYLYIDDKKLEEELPFGFRNSLDLEPKDIDNTDKIAIRDKGSNLRIDNGIFIDSENDTFKFRKLYYTKDSDLNCKEKIGNNFCKGKYLQKFKNFKIIQFYDNVEPNNKNISYFIKHDDKYLYVDNLKDSSDNIIEDEYEIKKLEMDDICHTEGDTYRYLFDDISYGEENIDKNTVEDKEFNRSYTDIPEKDMCPINFPFACSDDINWRNKCSQQPANTSGKCFDAKTITSKDNKPMRNFNCHGFKCYNKEEKYKKYQINKFISKNIKEKIKDLDILKRKLVLYDLFNNALYLKIDKDLKIRDIINNNNLNAAENKDKLVFVIHSIWRRIQDTGVAYKICNEPGRTEIKNYAFNLWKDKIQKFVNNINWLDDKIINLKDINYNFKLDITNDIHKSTSESSNTYGNEEDRIPSDADKSENLFKRILTTHYCHGYSWLNRVILSREEISEIPDTYFDSFKDQEENIKLNKKIIGFIEKYKNSDNKDIKEITININNLFKEISPVVKKANDEYTLKENNDKWSPDENYCKIPTNRFAKKNITQFLFNINAFKCEAKEGTTEISELSFCHSHPQLERKQAKNIPFFDKVVIVNEGEKPTTEGAIKIKGIKDLKLSENENLYDLYAIKSNEQNGIKEGITEFKIVGPEENCSEIPTDNTTFPSKWKEAKNESKIIGCYGRNNIFDFEKDSIDTSTLQDNLDICKDKSNKNYYGFQPLDSNGNCLESDTVPFLPRDKNFKDCASSDENINGLCNGKICGYTTPTNVNKISIYKNIKEGDEQSNIKNNRVYHNFSYKIFNKSAGYMYKLNNEGFLSTKSYDNNNIEDSKGDYENTDTFIKIVRVSGVDKQTPICYNEPIHLRFTINKDEKTLKANPIKGHDRTYILHENKFLNADIDDRITSNHTLRRRGAVESYMMTFPEGYNIKKTTKKEDTGKFYFFSTDKEGSMREEDNSRGDRRAIKQKDYNHGVINYHGNCLKHNIPTDREDASDTKVGKYDDVNQKSNPDSYEEIKIDCGENNNVDFVTSQLKNSYFGGFHKLINKEDTIKEGNEYYIYSTITEYFKYIGSHDDGNSYIRQVRGILNKDFSNVSHFNTDHKIKLSSDINEVPRKNNKIEIFPSSINKYNIIGTNNNISLVKTDNNFCFTTNSELEELEFKIVKSIGSEVSDKKTFNTTDYIDIGKDGNRQNLYLYNDLYNFYLTINKKDTNKNSVIYYDGINKENVTDYNCQFNMVMAKIDDYVDIKLQKVCYKTTPHQTIDITKINMNMGKTCSTGIKMNENKLLNNYSFCTNQEESSQDLNNSFNPATYVNSNPYKPYPIPEKL